MSWKEKLQPASFRGVPFVVESDDSKVGRRVQVFEYPQKDVPNTEDMGRKARERNLTAFVIGPEYMAARDNLLEAIEKAGPGELVHPWFGRMIVTVTDVSVSHSNAEGGMCRFQLAFVETGELAFPAANNAPGAQSARSVDVLEAAAKEDFSKVFSVDNLPDFAVQDAVSVFNKAITGLEGALGNVGGILGDPVSALPADLGDLVRTPIQLADRIFGLFSKTSAVISLASGLSDISSLNFLRVFKTLRSVALFPAGSSSGNTPTRTRMATNTNAINQLLRQTLIAQSAGMTATMALPVYDDAVKLQSELLTTIDNESAQVNDSLFLALVDLRAKVHADMTVKVQNAARLVNLTPKVVQPALVLSYDLYESVDREGEIVARNKLRHPGFIPAETIKVLSV
ncbi:MAG TPA: DNA circularization N-terminal domain-containing protein [Methylophilaceae bacterium]|nr:DNA circularization N-terminal domain-containing protein [Methylophilaceae bacterium]